MFKLTQPSSDGEIESATNSEASSHLNISTISQNKALHIVFPNKQLLYQGQDSALSTELSRIRLHVRHKQQFQHRLVYKPSV
jgi:hypothetical protein